MVQLVKTDRVFVNFVELFKFGQLAIQILPKTNATAETYGKTLAWSAGNFLAVGDHDRLSDCIRGTDRLNLQSTIASQAKLFQVKHFEYCLFDAEGKYDLSLVKSQEWLDLARKCNDTETEEVLNAETAKAEALIKSGQVRKSR